MPPFFYVKLDVGFAGGVSRERTMPETTAAPKSFPMMDIIQLGNVRNFAPNKKTVVSIGAAIALDSMMRVESLNFVNVNKAQSTNSAIANAAADAKAISGLA